MQDFLGTSSKMYMPHCQNVLNISAFSTIWYYFCVLNLDGLTRQQRQKSVLRRETTCFNITTTEQKVLVGDSNAVKRCGIFESLIL